MVITYPIIEAAKVFINNENSYAAEPSSESLADGIEYLILHPEMCETFSQNLPKIDFSNAGEIYKLLDFIGENKV